MRLLQLQNCMRFNCVASSDSRNLLKCSYGEFAFCIRTDSAPPTLNCGPGGRRIWNARSEVLRNSCWDERTCRCTNMIEQSRHFSGYRCCIRTIEHWPQRVCRLRLSPCRHRADRRMLARLVSELLERFPETSTARQVKTASQEAGR